MLVVVQLDAFRHDYLGPEAPFLGGLARCSLSGALVPTFGFEPDAAYLAGLWPDEADGGAQFWVEEHNSPFRFTRSWPAALDSLPKLPQKVLRRGVKWFARRNCPAPVLTAAMVPFPLLHCFGSPLKAEIDAPGWAPSSTVFDALRQQEKKWLIHAGPNNRVTLQAALRRAEVHLKPPLDFAFFHIGNLDRAGHEFGPNSAERLAEMAVVDAGMAQLHRLASERFGECHWLIFGDHGMAEVSGHVNVQAVLKSLRWKLREDYLVFLDSTMARFWFFNEQARPAILEGCAELGGGHWISSEERNRYHLNYRHNRFGDEVFIADPGKLISPNFYQGSDLIRGMHGYVPETPDQQSALVLHSPRITKGRRLDRPQDMRRIFPTLIELLDLPGPGGLGVESLLREVPLSCQLVV